MLIIVLLKDPACSNVYPLSLHDALPICIRLQPALCLAIFGTGHPMLTSTLFAPICSTMSTWDARSRRSPRDRKSTRLNSSHVERSYAVFCSEYAALFDPLSTNDHKIAPR